MRLHRIDISNFRSIKDASIVFEPRLRTLIGKNEAGKSNILAACALLNSKTQVSAADLREAHDEESPVKSGYVRAIHRLSSDEKKELLGLVQQSVLGVDIPLYQRGKVQESPLGVAATINEVVRIISIPDGNRSDVIWRYADRELLDGWVIPNDGADLSELQAHFKLESRISLAHSSVIPPEHSHLFGTAKIGAVEKVFFSLVDNVVDTTPTACLYWRYAEENLLPASVNIEAFKSNPKSCEPLRSMFKLAGESNPTLAISNAQQRPNGFKNLLTRVARATTKHLSTRWKELGGVEVVLAPNGENIDAAVKDAFNEFSFARRSDGFKRFISFLILVSARSATNDLQETLFIQDEPDLGLHPSGARSLLQELIKLSQNNYVLVSTHSIFMIDKDRIDRHIVVEKVKEETLTKSVDFSVVKDEEVLFNALGYSLFDVARPKNIIFEGWRDKKLFEVFTSRRDAICASLRANLKAELGLAYAMGVKDAPRVASFFQSIGRRFLIVSDSDETALQKQLQYADGRRETEWKRYDELAGRNATLTAEDFVTSARLRGAISKVLDRRGIAYRPSHESFEDAVPAAEAALRELRAAGVAADLLKAVSHEWKSEVFDDLQTKDIRLEYAEVARGIAAALELE